MYYKITYTFGIGRICGGSIKEHEINSADMILLVFQSDSSSGDDGFHVEFSVSLILFAFSYDYARTDFE